jgi:hypothetical protein
MLFLAGLLTACSAAETSATGGGGASSEGGMGGTGGTPVLNSDGDCLDDDQELEAGTDPTKADTDGDSFDDCAEIDCGSDPVDPADKCYACGWHQNDPGTLVSTGAAEGDVIANLELVDQCKEPVKLWDFAGEYHILFMTASW